MREQQGDATSSRMPIPRGVSGGAARAMGQGGQCEEPLEKTCKFASGIRNLNCMAQRAASELVPNVPRGAFCAVVRGCFWGCAGDFDGVLER
eukprot:2363278-Alexandrium_andersonii.AAC.1